MSIKKRAIQGASDARDIAAIGASQVMDAAVEMKKLPWNRLTTRGWFYIIYLVLIASLFCFFVVPNMKL